MKRSMLLALAAASGVYASLAAVPAAYAAPVSADFMKGSQPSQSTPGIVEQVKHGGGGGGGGRGFGGGGGGGAKFGGGGGGGARFSGPRGGGGGRFIGRGGPGFKGFKGGSGPRFSYRGGGKHHHHHRGPRGLYYAAPFAAYGAYYGSGYYNDGYSCAWLRRRAEATGSRYWWSRYADCVDDNY